jgi:hypothetical protein
VLHEMAVIGSHRRPQPLQWLNGERGSSLLAGRPSTLSGCSRSTHVVPQQRSSEAQVGLQLPVIIPRSGRSPPSRPSPEHTPFEQLPVHGLPHAPQLLRSVRLNTHSPSQQICDDAHGIGHELLVLPAHPAAAHASTNHEAKTNCLDTMALPSSRFAHRHRERATD